MKTCLCLLALASFALAGCHRDATVSTDQADRATTIAPSESPATQAASLDGWRLFGEPVVADVPAVDVADVLAAPAAYSGRDLALRGTVSEVCRERGCWMRITDESGSDPGVFVKFTCPIEGRLIPEDAVGKPVIVHGQVVVEEMSEGEARHYARDAGRPQAEIDAIVGPQTTVRVMSPTARVKV